MDFSSKKLLNSAFGTKIGTKNGQFLGLMNMITCIRSRTWTISFSSYAV